MCRRNENESLVLVIERERENGIIWEKRMREFVEIVFLSFSVV